MQPIPDSTTLAHPAQERPIDWVAVVFIAAMHLLALAGALHLVFAFSWWNLLAGVLMYLACGFSITAGYHRLFSHRSYRARWPLRLFLLLFGAATFQRSALLWSAEHRIHHRYPDEALDPYSVAHGFWWAHFGWIIRRNEVYDLPEDLSRDVLIRLQHRFWLPVAVTVGLVLPAALGLLWGDPLGAFLVAGALRIVMTWHATWSVNSFAHRFGRQTFAPDHSARDNVLVALLTLGEGYHSFHHRFQKDYRNGVRWFHYDPTKWFLAALGTFGIVGGLVRTPASRIREVMNQVAVSRRRT